MEISKLENMFNGWFIGDFEPTLFKTIDFEVAIKKYKAGAIELSHHHKIATEYTAVVSGKIEMNGITYGPETIIKIFPNESVSFKSITESITVVVKVPSSSDDKFMD